MNRLPDSGRGYRYGRTPEFPQPNQQRPEEGFSRFAQGSHFDRRDLLSSSDSSLGRAPYGYGSGQVDMPVQRPLVPDRLPNPCIPLYFMAITSSCDRRLINTQLAVSSPTHTWLWMCADIRPGVRCLVGAKWLCDPFQTALKAQLPL